MLVMAVGSREGGRVEGTERKGGWLFHIDSSVPFDFFFFFCTMCFYSLNRK